METLKSEKSGRSDRECPTNNRTHSHPMPVWKRAKQFMPFSAVEGLTEALHRKEEEREEYDSVEHIPGDEFVDF